MKRFLVILLNLWLAGNILMLAMLAGCEMPENKPGKLPPPIIEVEIKESTCALTFCITFSGDEATMPTYRKMKLTLTEEELGGFRKQVEFLLGRIDEAQQKQERRISNNPLESNKP